MSIPYQQIKYSKSYFYVLFKKSFFYFYEAIIHEDWRGIKRKEREKQEKEKGATM